MQIKTNCSQNSQSKDKKTFTFCQSGRCCSTGGLPAQNQRCKQNNYKAHELGECGKSHFDFRIVQGNVTWHDVASATDDWTPEWVKLVLRDEAVIKCSFGRTSLGETHYFSTFSKEIHFLCKPEGNFFFHSINIFDNYAMLLVIYFMGDCLGFIFYWYQFKSLK